MESQPLHPNSDCASHIPAFIHVDGENVDYSSVLPEPLFGAGTPVVEPALAAGREPSFLGPMKASLYCTLCWSDTEEETDHAPCALGCGHVFGLECLMQWFPIQSFPSCPACLRPVIFSELRIIYATTRDHAKLFEYARKEAAWKKQETVYRGIIASLAEMNKTFVDGVKNFIQRVTGQPRPA